MQFIQPSRAGAVVFGADDSHLLTAVDEGIRWSRLKDGTERVWTPDDYRPDAVMAFSPNGKYFLTSTQSKATSDDTAVRVYDLARQAASTGGSFKGSLESLALSPDGKHLVIEEAVEVGEKTTRFLRIGQLVNDQFIEVKSVPINYQATRICFSLDGGQLAVATGTDVIIMNAKGLQEITRLSFPAELRAVALSQGGAYLAAASGAQTRIVKVATQREVSVVEDDHPVRAVAFRKDNTSFVTASAPDSSPLIELPDDNVARVWRFGTEELLNEADQRLPRKQFNEDECRRYLSHTSSKVSCSAATRSKATDAKP